MSRVAPRIVLCAALVVPARGLRAQDPGEIDWQRGVVKAMGRGAPDLNAPSIAVARAAAERAALAAAQRNALRILGSARLDDGAQVETVLHDDSALRSRVEGKLRGVRAVRTQYFTDGGVWLEIEVPFALLPQRLADHLRPPEDARDAGGKPPEPAQDAGEGPVDAPQDAGPKPGDGGELPR